MGSSMSNNKRKRNSYLEHYPAQDFYSNMNAFSNSMLPQPQNYNYNLNRHYPCYASTTIQRNVGQQPPYARNVMNDVNLLKHTLRIDLDPINPDHHLISFIFDALYDGRITIIYLAKEEENCRFTPLYPQASKPITFPFQRGLCQKFCQPSGTGIDLRLFQLDDLSNTSPEQDVFPLIVCAETDALAVDASPYMQITQAVLDKSDGATGTFQAKVVKQVLWIDQVRFELIEIYGTGDSMPSDFERNDPGKDCVICIIEPRDIVVLPCRHMSMCRRCAKALRFRSNKCPICHEPIRELIAITR